MAKKKKKPSKHVARTAFVPRIVFRAVFKTAIPVVSSTVLPACLAVDAFGDKYPDGSINRNTDETPDAWVRGGGHRDASDGADANSLDGADASDGRLGSRDGSTDGG